MTATTSSKNIWFTRKSALLSVMAGILFLLAAVFAKDWDWRRILSFTAGVCWLVIAYRQCNIKP